MTDFKHGVWYPITEKPKNAGLYLVFSCQKTSNKKTVTTAWWSGKDFSLRSRPIFWALIPELPQTSPEDL